MTGKLPVRYESVSALYPIQRDDRPSAIVSAVLVQGEKHDGKPVLSRQLTAEECGMLTARKQALSEALQPAKPGEMKNVLIEMFLGFNKTASRDEAAAIASQFIKVLALLPLWAVKRACAKFERGEAIDGLEGVARMIVDSKGPTTAQLYPVAKAIVDDYYVELNGVRQCLGGIVPKVISAEERAIVQNGLNELAATMRSRVFSKPESAPFSISDDELRRMYPRRDQEKMA